jgi:prevent-host-death family protein
VTDRYSTYEAKAKLSEILRKVERGQTVVISRHGTPVAEVRPVRNASTRIEQRIAELTARGVIVPSSSRPGRWAPVAHRPGALQRFLDERGE